MIKQVILASLLVVSFVTLGLVSIQAKSPDRAQRPIAELVPSHETIRRTQDYLTELSYDPGPIDGLIGPRTRASIRAFQKAADLPVTGKLSADLLYHLTKAVAAIQLETPPAVSPKERMRSYPSPGGYIAFSLKIAKRIIAGFEAIPNHRTVYPEIYNLGGINQLYGLVYNREAKDVILVGQHNPDRQPLTLDDFVVAIRARFIHGTWPLVSIDPTDQTKQTGIQVVRFEGGIEETQFGADLLDADYRLKQISMGLIPSGIPGVRSTWDMYITEATDSLGGKSAIDSRLWFEPVLPNVSVRQDVVAIKGLKVGIFTEVLSAEINGKRIEDLSTFRDEVKFRFAKALSEYFDEISQAHASFSRIHGLDELVALAYAMEQMDETPDLAFWLNEYNVKQIRTPMELKVLTREATYRLSNRTRVYKLQLSGGVRLMAIALRLRAGDVTALKEAVLTTRPRSNTLAWSFVVGNWLIPTSPGMLKLEDIALLFAQAMFLHKQNRYDDAIALYDKIIELKGDWSWPYNNRGAAYGDKEQYTKAISDFDKALSFSSRYSQAYYNRAVTYFRSGNYDQALADYAKALEINPLYAEAYNNRGAVYEKNIQYDQALADYTKSLEIYPRSAEIYTNRARVYIRKYQYNQAIADLTKALELKPMLAEVYYNRGVAYVENGQYNQALTDYAKALEIKPTFAEAYHNIGLTYLELGRTRKAIAAFKSFVQYASPEEVSQVERVRNLMQRYERQQKKSGPIFISPQEFREYERKYERDR